MSENGSAAGPEPRLVLRLRAAAPQQLSDLLDAGDATLLARARAAGGQPIGDGPSRLAVVEPTPRKLGVARTAVRRSLGTPIAWRGRHDVWYSPAGLLAPGGLAPAGSPAAATAFVFPGLEADFAPRVDDVAHRFGLPTPQWGTQDLPQHARSVVALGRLLDGALRRIDVRPGTVAGQSIGEWVAMASAGMYEGVEFDRRITRFDPLALRVPDVDYLVLGCSAERARAAIPAGSGVVVSHDNSPRQAIVCGPGPAVTEIMHRLRGEGVISRRLTFRSGFHTPMFEPFLGPYREYAESMPLHPATVPVWSAATAAPYPTDVAEVRRLFLRTLVEPVLLRPLIERLYASGIRVFVQVGYGQLASLIDDILGDREHLALSAVSRDRPGLDQLLRVAAGLWVEGAEPDFTPLAAGVGPGGPAPAPPAPRVLRFSTARQPWLRDHAFFRQRSDWPQEADRWPVVPAAALIHSMIDEAEATSPGRRAVSVTDVRLRRWLPAAPPTEVAVDVTRQSPDHVRLRLGPYVTGGVELAAGYPPPGPARLTDPAAGPSRLSARRVYDERLLFHGPAFQGITEILGVGAASVSGVITVPPAPGGLLDSVAQLAAVWLHHQPHRSNTVGFPVAVERLTLFGPHPAPGTTVTATLAIRSFDRQEIVADAEVCAGGRVVARVTGWRNRRLLTDAALIPALRFPDRQTLATRRPGGWLLVTERWPDLAEQDLVAGGYLAAPEHDKFTACSPRARRQWLLGRIAVKDAVRHELWARGRGPMFPAEVTVANDPQGRPVVAGAYGTPLPDLEVSLAHCREVAVAIARERSPGRVGGIGIDVEEITDRPAGALDVAFGEAERRLYDDVVRAGDQSAAWWFTRFWTAKEAAAKAEGTGFVGQPRRFAVVSATPSALTVRADPPDARPTLYRVRAAQVTNPPGFPARHYQVAWTTTATADSSRERDR